MEIYILLYVFILGVPKFVGMFNKRENIQKKEAILLTLAILLLLALRHPSMGNDLGYTSSYGYLASFKNLARKQWTDIWGMESYLNYEKGYIIFNKIISYISDDYQCLLITCAVLSIVPIGFIIYKYSNDQVFSWIIYLGMPCFLMCYSGLRQSIAIGLCCFSLYFVERKKLIVFLVVIAIATSFHYTAFLAVLLYPLFWLKLDQNKRFVFAVIPFIVFVFKKPLFLNLYRILKDKEQVVEENGAITLFLVFVGMYLFCNFFLDENDKIAAGFLNIFLVACCCQAFGGIYMLAQRVGFYFMVPITISMPNIVFKIKDDKTRTLLKLLITIIFIAYGLYAIKISTWAKAFPYHFFWSSDV